jgi:hypothetical protein
MPDSSASASGISVSITTNIQPCRRYLTSQKPPFPNLLKRMNRWNYLIVSHRRLNENI